MMSPREFVGMWVASFAFTGYVVGLAFGAVALLGDVMGACVALVFGLAPLVVWLYFVIVEH